MNVTASSSCSNLTSQSTCDIECDEGYTASNPTMTCVRGEWFGSATCEPNSCVDDLPLIEQMDRTASRMTCNNTSSDSTCEISCENGYTPSGSLECSLGLWIERTMPTCDLDCSSNPPIQFLNNIATMCQSISSGSACENVTCLRSSSGYYSIDETGELNIPQVADLINDAIPEKHAIYWYRYTTQYIQDGGGNMYDNGNYIQWNGANLLYKYAGRYSSYAIEVNEYGTTNSEYLIADYVWDGSYRSGFGATYKSSIRSSSMVLEATVTSSGTFSIYGNLGGNGQRQIDEYDLSAWRVFRTSTYNTGAPTINHLIFLSDPVANAGATRLVWSTTSTDLENHRIQNIAPGTKLIYIMYSTRSGYTMSDAEHRSIVEMVEHSFGRPAPVCYNGTYVVPIQSSITDDFSTYVSVDTYESTESLICAPDPCDSEPLIANYTGSGCANTASNATCDVNCDQGYHQVNGPATCYAGMWTEPLPTCEEDPCPDVR